MAWRVSPLHGRISPQLYCHQTVSTSFPSYWERGIQIVIRLSSKVTISYSDSGKIENVSDLICKLITHGIAEEEAISLFYVLFVVFVNIDSFRSHYIYFGMIRLNYWHNNEIIFRKETGVCLRPAASGKYFPLGTSNASTSYQAKCDLSGEWTILWGGKYSPLGFGFIVTSYQTHGVCDALICLYWFILLTIIYIIIHNI